ncbi:SIMPL domain-containing protein [Undibacterium arcticum]|uniref:SIMPL domain-containing protein n=1 Tax=Undibacterium arcticum TaxID=1762892 RepID=A0ABV7F5Z5_9BURK
MSRFGQILLPLLLCMPLLGAQAQSQPLLQTSGTLVIVPAFGEVKHANDEAHLTLMIEEQDRDKAAAASRVNQKMKQGVEIVKREDPQATLKTRGYYTYPVYPEDQPQPRPNNKVRQPASWRVGQYLDVTTTNLATLPKTVAATQRLLAINGLRFGLSDAASRKLDEARIAATYKDLTERIASIAKAMGRNPADAILDTVDFEGSGAYAQQQDGFNPKVMSMAGRAAEPTPIEVPSFEPGETTLQMRVVGKVKFR